MIFIPIWALNHSEHLGFKDPETFNPDRYLNHRGLANEYAGSPDYNQRDKSPFLLSPVLVPLLSRRILCGLC